MIDPLSVLDDICAEPGFPGSGFPFPGKTDATGNGQISDITNNSRSSRNSRSVNEDLEKNGFKDSETACSDLPGVARTSSYQNAPGTPGIPGTEGKTLARSTLSQFPVKDREPGTPGTESEPCGRSILDMNPAAPPPPGDPLPISEVEVRAGVKRELRALGDIGRTGPDALRDAIEITAAKIRNSAALAESQSMDGRCHMCQDPLDGTRPEVAVMQGKPGSPLHIHSACHADHKARRTALVDKIMAAAGYRPAQTDGEAA